MAEYNDVIKQFKRMCKSVTPVKCTRGECPMGCENIGQCRKVAFEQPSCFEGIVMSWAVENPEPVYPTWYEYLSDYYRAAFGDMSVISKQPIPVDIAEKLGIKPKE